MSLSDKIAGAKKYTERLQQEKMKAAQSAVDDFMKTDQWKMAVRMMPEGVIDFSGLTDTVVRAVTDPVSDYLAVLRAKGFRNAEIRKLTHRLYNAYCTGLDDTSMDSYTYESCLPTVADYVTQHQEIYSTLNPDELRSAAQADGE